MKEGTGVYWQAPFAALETAGIEVILVHARQVNARQVKQLSDSKTGPRTVWLSSAARAILDCISRKSSWIFPSTRTNRAMTTVVVDQLWYRVRAEADLHEVRIHDLRHTYASIAMAQGETVLTIGRLLGHRDPETTMKYTQLSDAMVREAIDTIGAVLGG